MPSVITPTSPTFTQLIAPVVIATGNLGATVDLDLKTSQGARLFGRIGRRAATALTRSAYILCRNTDNDTLTLPNPLYDMISSNVAAISNTVASGGASGTNTVTLTSATSFAIGDTICLHSDDTNASRVEWARIVAISSNDLTVEANFRVSHNAADRVTTQGDVWTNVWLPGGDVYRFRAVNNSGQDVLFALDAIVFPGETVT